MIAFLTVVILAALSGINCTSVADCDSIYLSTEVKSIQNLVTQHIINIHSCEDEKNFYNCMKRVVDDPESIVAKEHFLTNSQCFVLDQYPIEGCAKYQPFHATFPRCMEYAVASDKKKEKFIVADTNYFDITWDYITEFRARNYRFSMSVKISRVSKVTEIFSIFT